MGGADCRALPSIIQKMYIDHTMENVVLRCLTIFNSTKNFGLIDQFVSFEVPVVSSDVF